MRGGLFEIRGCTDTAKIKKKLRGKSSLFLYITAPVFHHLDTLSKIEERERRRGKTSLRP